MLMTLNDVLGALHIDRIHRHYNEEKIVHYTGAKWLGNPQSSYNENCIYIGYSSELVEDLPQENIGLLLVNDDDQDLSHWDVDLVELDPAYDPAQICLKVKEQFFNTYEISSISQSLIEKTLGMYSIKELVDFISVNLENPVFINFHFGGRSSFFSGGSSVEEQAKILDEKRNHYPDRKTWDDVNLIWNSKMPTVFDDGFCYPGKKRMQAAITDGVLSNKKIGILTVFEVNRSFESMDHSFVAFMGHIISMKAGDPAFKKELFSHEYEQNLHDLITGAQIDPDQSWVNSLFGQSYRNFIVAITDTRNLSAVKVEDIKYHLLHRLSFGTIIMRGSYLVLIANLSKTESEVFGEIAEETAEKYLLLFGISDPFSDLFTIRKYYTQAKRVREMGPLLKADSGVLFFEKHKNTILIRSVAAAENPELFVNEAIDILIEHDRAENTEYVRTLDTYIRYGMNNDRTRSALNIHRNTLTYRLNRIEEILGHDLDNGEYVFNLYLSGLIRKVIGRKAFREE